jgi:hypothetical protein
MCDRTEVCAMGLRWVTWSCVLLLSVAMRLLGLLGLRCCCVLLRAVAWGCGAVVVGCDVVVSSNVYVLCCATLRKSLAKNRNR